MNPRIHITHLFDPRTKLHLRRERDGTMALVDGIDGPSRKVTQEEANAIALAVVDGTGVAEFSRSEAMV